MKTEGVCGSEVHAFEGTHPYRKTPVILEHETAGDILSVGEVLADFKRVSYGSTHHHGSTLCSPGTFR